jgi:glycosyltransferase involved in cell wall biosynthesis
MDARAATICICTRDRPQALTATLASIERSEHQVSSVVVSDDGLSPDTRAVATRSSLPVTFTTGPRQGLAANRNHALSLVETPFLVYLDDDCHFSATFLTAAFRCMAAGEKIHGLGHVVVTGRERRLGSIIEASDQSFCGFQKKPYRPDDNLRSIVINSTVFPTALVRSLKFDERLRYGYEEVELATRIVASGATIVGCSTAVNDHFPSGIGRADYEYDATVSRLYATWKRYAFTERRRARAVAFVAVAPTHAIMSGLKSRGVRGAIDAARAAADASRFARDARRDVRRHNTVGPET